MFTHTITAAPLMWAGMKARWEKKRKRGGRDVTVSVSYGLLFSVWQEDSCNSSPLRAEREAARLKGIDRQMQGERERCTSRKNVLKRKDVFFFSFFFFSYRGLLWTQPHPWIRRKTIRSTRFPLSRSVDYKWANLAFITLLQTFIKAGSPLKLQR